MNPVALRQSLSVHGSEEESRGISRWWCVQGSTAFAGVCFMENEDIEMRMPEMKEYERV
jgi:hypothetical protein